MYKAELVRRVAKETRLTQRIVSDVLTNSLATITQALRQEQPVVLPGFGTFYTKDRKPSQVRHITTREVIAIPAMRQADFRVGELLRRAVRRGKRGRPRTDESLSEGR
jgi:DNA-binding protein HU-beta